MTATPTMRAMTRRTIQRGTRASRPASRLPAAGSPAADQRGLAGSGGSPPRAGFGAGVARRARGAASAGGLGLSFWSGIDADRLSAGVRRVLAGRDRRHAPRPPAAAAGLQAVARHSSTIWASCGGTTPALAALRATLCGTSWMKAVVEAPAPPFTLQADGDLVAFDGDRRPAQGRLLGDERPELLAPDRPVDRHRARCRGTACGRAPAGGRRRTRARPRRRS